MPLSVRYLFLAAAAFSLTSCGTASHMLGQAGGLVNSITSPVLGAIRLSDTPDTPAPRAGKPGADKIPSHDSSPAPAKRPH